MQVSYSLCLFFFFFFLHLGIQEQAGRIHLMAAAAAARSMLLPLLQLFLIHMAVSFSSCKKITDPNETYIAAIVS